MDLVHNLVYSRSVTNVGVHEAKTNLSKLLRRVATGEEIIILRSGQPIAKLIPLSPVTERQLGVDEGAFEIPDDFNSLPDDLLAAFEA